MPNFKIPDLAAATTVADTDVLELCNPGLLSQKVTALQLQTYVGNAYPGILGGTDDAAIEFFDDYALGAITTFDQGFGWGANGVGSGATIVNKTMADGRTQNRLSLNAGYYGRRMPWGAFWNRIKLVLAVRLNHGVTFANADGYFGVCTGTTNMVNSATTTNFTGIRFTDGTGSATFSTGTKANYFTMGNFRACQRRVNTTTDQGALSSGHVISATEGYLGHIIVEISRPVFALDSTSINYSVAEASPNATSIQFSRTKQVTSRMALCDITGVLCNSDTDTTITNQAGVTCTPFAFDQSTGVLDTINFYWVNAIPFEIAGFVLRKVL